MQTTNPFEEIVQRLELLQIAVNKISFHASKSPEIKAADPERFIDLPEAATIMRKPVGTVRYYIHHRSLPAKKVGKSYLIKYAELINWYNELSDSSSSSEDPLFRMIENRKRYCKS